MARVRMMVQERRSGGGRSEGDGSASAMQVMGWLLSCLKRMVRCQKFGLVTTCCLMSHDDNGLDYDYRYH